MCWTIKINSSAIIEAVWLQVVCEQNSCGCVAQAVTVMIIIVSVNFEQWHISSSNNKKILIKTKTYICFYFGLQLKNSYINVFKRLKRINI